MSKQVLIPIVVIVAAVLIYAGYRKQKETNTNTITNSAAQNINTAAANTNASTNTNAAITGTTALSVSVPVRNEQLVSPYELKGTSTHDKIYSRVNNAAGRAVFTESANVRDGLFVLHLTFIFSHSETGSIDVYALDSAGKEVNLVNIPVTFKINTAGERDAQ